MLAGRTPVLGIAIAVLVLMLENVGLLAFRDGPRDVAITETTREIEAAVRLELVMAKLEAETRKLNELLDELERLDAEIERFQRPGCNSFPHPELRELQLLRARQKQRLIEHHERKQRLRDDRRLRRNDMLLVPTTGPTRGFDRGGH